MSLKVISLEPAWLLRGTQVSGTEDAEGDAGAGSSLFPWYLPRGSAARPQLLQDSQADPGFCGVLGICHSAWQQ